MSERTQVQCPRCEKWRWIQKGNMKSKRAKFTGICLSCYSQNPPTIGESNPMWKRGFSIDSRDYRYTTISTIKDEKLRELCRQSVANRSYGKRRSGRIYEHHIVMIQKLNRPLVKGEIIHHRDGNPSNNNLENLELTNQQDHIWKHKELLMENARLKEELQKHKDNKKT